MNFHRTTVFLSVFIVLLLFLACTSQKTGNQGALDSDAFLQDEDVSDTAGDSDSVDTGDSVEDEDSANTGDTAKDSDFSDTADSVSDGDSADTADIIQWGTTDFDEGNSVAVDSSGNIFVTGYTGGDLGGINAGKFDVFLTKYHSDGTQAWTKQWGTTDFDEGESVAVDSSGNIFVTGYTKKDLGGTNAGGKDIFLTKYHSDGTQAWTKQWGTTDDDAGESVAVDSTDNIVVTGYTGGDLGGISAGREDVFLTKYHSDGTQAWTKQRGTKDNDFGLSVALDSNDNIFVTGYTEEIFNGANAGASDLFLTKYHPDGTQAWRKYRGIAYSDKGSSVAVDSSGNIFVTGYIRENRTNINASKFNIFLTKYHPDGSEAWTKLWGTRENDFGSSVTVDSSGSIFVAGHTGGDFGGTNAGDFDIFLAKCHPDDTQTWAKQWGTAGDDRGWSIALDSSGNIFVTGFTTGDFGGTNAGGRDIFLIKVKP